MFTATSNINVTGFIGDRSVLVHPGGRDLQTWHLGLPEAGSLLREFIPLSSLS